ncbi:unnamed protein product [Adineta steineri]|uniref:Uncharacterized protein n=1 Tax=Adineta steineri TaxID=433720 RepID=A0A815HH19_9BILA|nr:unnamed protein product [Adineta steineri]CAF1598170.1 unnamed protein product [Adineta steineri]
MTTIQVTDRLLARGVLSTISENQLRKELLTNYHGIKHVQRLYMNDEYNTPKELVQIDFTSPKHTETFLENGFIDICNLRCPVKALNSSTNVQNHLENVVTNKILVHDVSTEILMNEFGEKLSKSYPGIKYVKRWFQTNGSEVPTERVQIDFESSKYTQTILQDGFIHIGELYWPVTPIKPNNHLRKQLESDSGSDNQSEIYTEQNIPQVFDEQSILQAFEEQKQKLSELIRYFDVQLNNIVHPQNKSGVESSSG